MTTDTLQDFAKIRNSRRNAALTKYREIVEAIAGDEAEPADFAKDLDDIMLQLGLSDEDLAGDVVIVKEYRRRQVNAASDERHTLDAQIPGLDKKVRKAEKALQAAQRRHEEAQEERRQIGLRIQRFRDSDGEIVRLNQNNPRLFASLGAPAEAD